MTLMELMVGIAIALMLMAILVPSTSSFFQLRQRKAAKKLVMLYQQLHDEAVLRNATFRVVYDLQANAYKVEVGESRAIIYSSPEQRERYETELKQRIALMDEKELAEFHQRNKPFEQLQTHFNSTHELPAGVRLYGVYTPQYGKMITLDDIDPKAEEPLTILSYVFANGFSEHTVIWLVDEKNREDGWTIEIEPLSGRIHLYGELIDWQDSQELVPQAGPSLPT